MGHIYHHQPLIECQSLKWIHISLGVEDILAECYHLSPKYKPGPVSWQSHTLRWTKRAKVQSSAFSHS